MGWKKNLGIGLGVVITVGGAIGINYLRGVGAIASGMVSQTLCTNVLILGRDRQEVFDKDLSAIQRRVIESTYHKDYVTSRFKLGPITIKETSSIYREGLGCTIATNVSLDDLRQSGLEGPKLVKANRNEFPWPAINPSVEGVNYQALNDAVNDAFIENSLINDEQKNTRGVLVHYKGELIAERYGENWDGTMPSRAMSMTKSFASTIIGLLVGEGRLNVDKPTGLEGWDVPDSLKSKVNLHHILKMTSGFAYNEAMEQDPTNVLNEMLFASFDSAAFAAKQKLDKPVGSYWDYQTVNSVLLQKIARNAIGDDQEYFRYAQEKLFNKIGMTDSFFQADASGTFTGGALFYGSARDYMRYGLMYLNDGVVNGEQILPKGWVEYTQEPSKASMDRKAYGAQFWSNAPSKEQWAPELPHDMYAAKGHYGQFIVIIPSLELVIVRIGMTLPPTYFDLDKMLYGIINSLNV